MIGCGEGRMMTFASVRLTLVQFVVVSRVYIIACRCINHIRCGKGTSDEDQITAGRGIVPAEIHIRWENCNERRFAAGTLDTLSKVGSLGTGTTVIFIGLRPLVQPVDVSFDST